MGKNECPEQIRFCSLELRQKKSRQDSHQLEVDSGITESNEQCCRPRSRSQTKQFHLILDSIDVDSCNTESNAQYCNHRRQNPLLSYLLKRSTGMVYMYSQLHRACQLSFPSRVSSMSHKSDNPGSGKTDFYSPHRIGVKNMLTYQLIASSYTHHTIVFHSLYRHLRYCNLLLLLLLFVSECS